MMGEKTDMERLILEAGKSTPYIHFDPRANLLHMKGESYPENAAKFYSPVFSWLEKYLSLQEKKQITVDLELFYFNSSSSKVLMNFFEMLEEAALSGHQVRVNWRYNEEDELALECGEELQEDAPSVTFSFISVSK